MTAATHCVLDSELHVLQTGQIFKPDHFSARRLYSPIKFLEHSNICAGENIIGPISDVQHVTLDEDDIWDDPYLDEDFDDEDDEFFGDEDDVDPNDFDPLDIEDWEDFEDWAEPGEDGWVDTPIEAFDEI